MDYLKKILLIVLLNVMFGNISHANISQADHDALFIHLKILESGWVQNSVNVCNTILPKSEYTWEDWVIFFNEYYASNHFTDGLDSYIGYPMFYWFDSSVHYKLQLSHKIVFQNRLNNTLSVGNLDILLKDSVVNRKELFWMLKYLGRFTFKGLSVLADSSKNSVINECEGWVNAYPTYYKRTSTVSCSTSPYRALIGLQLHSILMGYEQLTPNRINYLVYLFGLSGRYASLMQRHQLYVADNNKMSTADLNYLDSILTYIPDTLTDLRLLSGIDYYYCAGQDRIDIENRISAVNTFSTIGGYNENSFPSDITPMYIDGFSVVVAHEINHTLDPDYIYKNPILTYRRSQLLQRAGSNDMQYLRSWAGSGSFFQNSPQEFVASIANQWFCSSEHTLQLGLTRFDSNYKEPINQVLFFCELYSTGGSFTRFYTTNTAGKITVQNIDLGRDVYGHINRLTVGNNIYSFVLDTAGYVLGYNKSSIISGISNTLLSTIRYYPNPTNTILFIEGLPEKVSVGIYDQTGNLLFSQVVGKQINVSSLSKGIYLLKIEVDGVAITKEFIKL